MSLRPLSPEITRNVLRGYRQNAPPEFRNNFAWRVLSESSHGAIGLRSSISNEGRPVVVRSFSTRPPPSDGGTSKKSFLSGMWSSYQDRTAKKTFQEHLDHISRVDTWTLDVYRDLVAKTAKSWSASVPGVSSTAEVKQAKESLKVVESIINVLGGGSGVELEDMYNLSRIEKLKAANDAEVTVERVDQEVLLFESAAQTHMLLMELKNKGKPFPQNQEEMKQAMQANAKKLMTAKQKERMKEYYLKKMQKDFR